MNKKNIATTSERYRADAKLLVINAEESDIITKEPIYYLKRNAFVDQFEEGDVIVANGAATLPASFSGIHWESGLPIELRLAQSLNAEVDQFSLWKAVVLGDGDWRMPTEARTKVPHLNVGNTFKFDHGLSAKVNAIATENSRLVDIEFIPDEGQLLHLLYQAGRLIQYSYHQENLELWDGQTIFAGKPIALEPPSASFPLTWETILTLDQKGVQVVYLFHAAGISSTGEEELDQLLPLPEYYEIPSTTAEAINRAKVENQRIIALGTSVTRALESAVDETGRVRAGEGIAHLLLSPTYERKIVTGLLTGMHEDGTSHLQLLQSFAPWSLIERSYDRAKKLGYLWHEYGDSCLIFA
ncbi:MAG: S-adenosylmethionine:tRNA ribosyltransferase-isomerase [Chloroflexota bacterium]